MTVVDFSIAIFQVALPLLLLAWLAARPARNAVSFLLQLAAIALYLAALLLIPVWLVPPWWTPWIYAAAAASILAMLVVRGRLPKSPVWPRTLRSRAAAAITALACAALAALVFAAAAGRALPGRAVDLAFPMGPGTYLVASGGSTETVNGHLLTLEPATERQRDYRGQSFGIDLVELGEFGLRAPGWRPRDPAAYEIFGSPVHAPCAGEVLSALDDMPDMPVPATDTSRLEGNHVFLRCGEFGVLLAHLREGSLAVSEGQRVVTGQHLGEAGNSGKSTEPHLHVHAQRVPSEGALLSGEPLHVTFDGRFLVRNDRVKIPQEN